MRAFRSPDRTLVRRSLYGTLGLVVAAGLLFWVRATVHAQSSEQLTIYSAQTTYSVPLLTIAGQPYAGLVDVFEPLGSIDARADGKKYKLKFTAPGGKQLEAQFTEGKEKGKLRGDNYSLPANFAIQNGRGYVPLSAVADIVSKLAGKPAQLHASARRLFVGEVPVRFTLDLQKGNPSKLVVSFPTPVNPTISTEPGRVRMTFRREPVISGGQDSFNFDDQSITGAVFAEHDGIAELDVNATAPLLANFADGGKTIIVSAVPPPPPPPVTTSAPQTPEPSAPPAPKAPSGPRFVVIVDPAHGGSDNGASITPSLLEKDVVLQLARRVQRELVNRGIATAPLRVNDATLSLDQRATAVNAARPALYVSLHAANTGRGVHVFTSLLPAANLSPTGFLPWDSAQAAFLDLSGTVAGSVAAELENRKLPNSTLLAPLRPMNNIAAPAIAIEIASPDENPESIANAKYQEQVAQAIAAGVAAVRSKLPEVRP
jgi:N-acetylmuramoyl-L-alanine amidase